LYEWERTVYPLKVSDNGRYLVDREGTPVFWLGTTQWGLVRDHTLEEATLILEKTAATGFAFAQVMLLGSGAGTAPNLGKQPNVDGELPWIDGNPLTPNEAYFRHVDAVIEIARQKNVVISLTVFHQHQQEIITVANARPWARWLAQRYRDMPNIVWSTTPHAKPEFAPVLRDLMAGLREGDGRAHLITCKPDPGPYSSSFIHAEPCLDFNSIQTWTWVERIYPLVTTDYQLEPVKPVLMAEGAYERGSEYDFDVTPLWVRRQAYYSYLAGAHHTYGHNDSWRLLPTWREALDAPGAAQLGLLRRILEEREEWWNLVPDQLLLTNGGQTEGRVLNLAARHKDGKWALVYCAAVATVAVDLSRLAGKECDAFWVDPRSAESIPVGHFATQGSETFSAPREWEDALLVVEAVAS
jgi:hypothetical protein